MLVAALQQCAKDAKESCSSMGAKLKRFQWHKMVHLHWTVGEQEIAFIQVDLAHLLSNSVIGLEGLLHCFHHDCGNLIHRLLF